MAEGPRMETCPACDGDRWVPCDCHLCRAPEGRACGVLGHVDRPCPACGGKGDVPAECAWCGYDLPAGSVHTEHGPMCPSCRLDALEAA